MPKPTDPAGGGDTYNTQIAPAVDQLVAACKAAHVAVIVAVAMPDGIILTAQPDANGLMPRPMKMARNLVEGVAPSPPAPKTPQ